MLMKFRDYSRSGGSEEKKEEKEEEESGKSKSSLKTESSLIRLYGSINCRKRKRRGITVAHVKRIPITNYAFARDIRKTPAAIFTLMSIKSPVTITRI